MLHRLEAYHRQKYLNEELNKSKPGSRQGYILLICPTHGEQPHLSYLNFECERCAQERIKKNPIET